MGMYVMIRKKADDEVHAEFEFGPNENRLGRIRIDKASGEMVVLKDVPDDTKSIYSTLAQRKIHLHWKDGEYPDATCWAS